MAAARFMENQGVQHNDLQKLELARQGYLTVLARKPNNQFAHHRLAIMAARGGQYDTAEIHFNKAAATGTASSELLADMGYNYYLQHRLEEAEQSLRNAIDKDPRNETAVNNLGLVLGEMGKPAEALAQFERVVGTAEAHANLAKVFTHMGQMEEAKQQYNLALSISPNMRSAAEALVQLDDATSARARAMSHSREQLASRRRPSRRRGSRDERSVARHFDILPDFDKLPGFEGRSEHTSEIRPVSNQRSVPMMESFDAGQSPLPADEMAPPTGMPSPASGIQSSNAFDPELSYLSRQAVSPRAVVEDIPDVQPAYPAASTSVQANESASMTMAEMAAKLGQLEADSQQEIAVEPVRSQPTQRVVSSADRLQAKLLSQQQPIFSEPPLPGTATEFTEFEQPAHVKTESVTVTPARSLFEHTPEKHREHVTPQVTQVVPQQITNPFFAEEKVSQPEQSFASSIIDDKVSGDVAVSSADTAQVAKDDGQETQPLTDSHDRESESSTFQFASSSVTDDLPVGEPNLRPISMPPQPAAAVTSQPVSRGGSPFDFRIPEGVEARSLQKLLDDEDY